MTTEELLSAVAAKFGYLVMVSRVPRRIGEIAPWFDTGRIPPQTLKQPMVVVAEATYTDYMLQVLFCEALCGEPIGYAPSTFYFYRVTTD